MKTAIITGASKGIGKAIAYKFAQNNYNLGLIARSETLLNEIKEDLKKSYGIEVLIYIVDVSDYKKAEEVVDDFYKRFSRIDVLVNNAGITDDKFLVRISESDWDNIISVNLKSVFNYCKFVSKYMIKQRSGVIVNISSISGIVGNAGQTSYASTKSAIIGFTKSLAKELGSRNVRVNAIAPGFILTDMTEKLSEEIKNSYLDRISLKRFGTPEEIANVVYFLCSDDASYITGQVLVVDGGMI
ncbi:MAG: 3-oxoacyl-[acyl-carrier-protein] reductase [candidate division WOR-3 bacterium]|nr:3-oxoacyl-[acyl-carrier-protein] reductase [candidate division WOR-3 bacterium]MCX7947080.1 3-oxoacyl-[acyl-carrier-protein] reductase [candidate division WOR-3 bacterium]MDW8149879.1 3-oxoacyl-[acyl-carrier-protein] reductase [candidate division WOR-3 bacterium]